MRNKFKELDATVKQVRAENRPLTRKLKRDLNIRHEDMNAIMKEFIEESGNRSSDDKRLGLEESVVVVNGFNMLDCDSDGLISVQDLEVFCLKRKCKADRTSIDTTMWILDDCRQGFLTLDDVKSYYFRVLEHYKSWTPLTQLEENYQIVMQSRPSAVKALERIASASAPKPHGKAPLNFPKVINAIDPSERGKLSTPSGKKRPKSAKAMTKPTSEEERLRCALAVVRKATEGMTESLYLYRLLMFAALENHQKKVHLLSALEQMVERFGPDQADLKFEQLFCKVPANLLDSEWHDLKSFLQNANSWDKKFEEFKKPISSRERGEIYTHSQFTEATKKKQKPVDEFDFIIP